jgi:thymidylate kinase
MIQIQLIGCTGAGKSTLARYLLQAFRERGIDALMGEELVLQRARLGWINAGLARILAVDLLSMFACLATWRRNREFYLFALRTVSRLPRTVAWTEKLNIARNVLKKVGIFEIVDRLGSEEQIVLVDEGTLHAAHNLFVHVAAKTDASDVSRFAQLVPLPQVVVYVRQSKPVLIARTMKRGHKRIPDRLYAQAEVFVNRAVGTFDDLIQQLVLEKRLFTVDNKQNVIFVQEYPPDPLLSAALDVLRASGRTATESSPSQMQSGHDTCSTAQHQVYSRGE